ncbi:hypothetical protein HanIR_Chr09g0446171 [Helianthus annuus]|nr:hypothetical protein HanIR_Chr09g0446171 [Helianthus annuus]
MKLIRTLYNLLRKLLFFKLKFDLKSFLGIWFWTMEFFYSRNEMIVKPSFVNIPRCFHTEDIIFMKIVCSRN